MLKGVVSDQRDGRGGAIPGYTVAGKTGTAQKPGPNGYIPGKYVASFVGMVPAKSPRLVVLVIGRRADGPIFGGVVAAPAFAQIAKFDLQYLEVPPARRSTLAATPRRHGAAAKTRTMDLERLVAALGPAEVLGRAPVEVLDLAYDARAVDAGLRCSSACPARAPTGTTSRPRRSGAAPSRSSSSGESTLPVPQLVVADARAAMAAAADVFFGDPTRELDGRRASPARTARRRPRSCSTRSSRRRPAARAARDDRGRVSAASAAASGGRRRRRSTCSGSSARWSTPATARA